MLWVHAVGDRRSEAILGQNFLRKTWNPHKKKRRQKKNLFAMRTVEFNQAMSEGKGLNRRPFPPRPLTWLTLCQCERCS